MATFGSILSNAKGVGLDRVNLYTAAPGGGTGGATGIGSNLAVDSNANLTLDPAYANDPSTAGMLRHSFLAATPTGSPVGVAGARVPGSGTLNAVSSGFTGTINCTAGFTANSAGATFPVKINAPFVSGTKVVWASGTLSGVTNDTTATLSVAFTDSNGANVAVPSGTTYSIDPDRLTTDTITPFQSPWFGLNASTLSVVGHHRSAGVFTTFSTGTVIYDDSGGGVGAQTPPHGGYGEVSSISNHVYAYRRGILAGSEWGTATISGKPARAYGLALIITEPSAYSTYANSDVFGTTSSWRDTGPRALMLYCNGATRNGTGIFISSRPPGDFQRPFVFNNGGLSYDAPGCDLVTIDYLGNLLFGKETSAGSAVAASTGIYCNQASPSAGPAKITLPGTNNVPADGIRFGSDANFVNLYRQADNTLRTDDHMNLGASLTVTGNTSLLGGLLLTQAGAAYIQLTERSSYAETPTAGTKVNMYMKADKLVVHYIDGATSKYYTLLLTQATAVDAPAAWVATQTAP